MERAERMLKSEAARKRRKALKEIREQVRERLYSILRKKRKKK